MSGMDRDGPRMLLGFLLGALPAVAWEAVGLDSLRSPAPVDVEERTPGGGE